MQANFFPTIWTVWESGLDKDMTVVQLSSFGKEPIPFNWTILFALVQEPFRNSGRPESLKLPITSVCVRGSSLLSSSISSVMDVPSLVRCLSLSFLFIPNQLEAVTAGWQCVDEGCRDLFLKLQTECLSYFAAQCSRRQLLPHSMCTLGQAYNQLPKQPSSP